MRCGYVSEGPHTITACSSKWQSSPFTRVLLQVQVLSGRHSEREEDTMKDDNRVHEVEGIDKGERLEIMTLNADEFILSVIEPEAYGDERQAASIALNREQMRELVSLTGTVLINTMGVNHNG